MGFLFDGQSFTTIVPPTSGSTTPTAINDVSQVIGVFFDNANPATQPSFLATPQWFGWRLLDVKQQRRHWLVDRGVVRMGGERRKPGGGG